VWCDPLTYTALQEHAPDFFDHYTALFTFLDAAPLPQPIETIFMRAEPAEVTRAVQRQVAASQAAVTFYEDQVERLREPTPERARALLGLAGSLWELRDVNVTPRLGRAEGLAREALSLLSPESEKMEWARGQNILGKLLIDLPTGDRAKNLRQAIACFEAALRVYSEADFPQEWQRRRTTWGLPTATYRVVTEARICAKPSPAIKRHCACAPKLTSRRSGQRRRTTWGMLISD
jgi:hypothetical protein